MNGWSLLEREELPAQFLPKRNLFFDGILFGFFTGGKGYPLKAPF